MIFVVFVLPISVVVEVLKERLVVPAENIFSDVNRLSAVACTASAPWVVRCPFSRNRRRPTDKGEMGITPDKTSGRNNNFLSYFHV